MTQATPGVLAEVQRERERQQAKFGEQNLTPPEWLMVLGEEVGEVNRAAVEVMLGQAADYAQYRAELVQVAAVAVHALESFDRQQARRSAPAQSALGQSEVGQSEAGEAEAAE